MKVLLSAKGDNFSSWRAAEDFAAAYRQSLLDLTASSLGGSAETVFSEAYGALETVGALHQKLVTQMNNRIADVAVSTPSTNLKELTLSFYSDLYSHFDHFRSAPAFYQLSMAYLRQVSAAITAHVKNQLGLFARHLPEMALVAVGPAGRGEYSPFRPLQILLVHGDVAAAHLQTLNLFCHSLHLEFENAGLVVDSVVTPQNNSWRCTVTEWRQRCEDGSSSQAAGNSIDEYRLVDQYPLYPVDGLAAELKQATFSALRGNRSGLTDLVSRMISLSNGLSLMGRLKLERSGRHHGMFKLLDHGLLPFSAALSALTLIKESSAVTNCERIGDLLKRREIDVEFAERMLAAWYCLNDLRLQRELSSNLDDRFTLSAFLAPDELSPEQRQSLKSTLESVASIQRYVEVIFTGMGA